MLSEGYKRKIRNCGDRMEEEISRVHLLKLSVAT